MLSKRRNNHLTVLDWHCSALIYFRWYVGRFGDGNIICDTVSEMSEVRT